MRRGDDTQVEGGLAESPRGLSNLRKVPGGLSVAFYDGSKSKQAAVKIQVPAQGFDIDIVAGTPRDARLPGW